MNLKFVLSGIQHPPPKIDRQTHTHTHTHTKHAVSCATTNISPQQTSDLLFQVHDDLDCHVEDAKLRLRLVCLQMCHAHPPKLLQCFIDVPDPYPTSTCHIQRLQDNPPTDMHAVPTALQCQLQHLYSAQGRCCKYYAAKHLYRLLIRQQKYNVAVGQASMSRDPFHNSYLLLAAPMWL